MIHSGGTRLPIMRMHHHMLECETGVQDVVWATLGPQDGTSTHFSLAKDVHLAKPVIEC